MDFITLLGAFIIMGAGLRVAIFYWNKMWLPFFDLKPYSLLEVFVLSVALIFTFNMGIFQALGLPLEITYQPWYNYVDKFITSLIMLGGANGVHKFIKIAKDALSKNEQ